MPADLVTASVGFDKRCNCARACDCWVCSALYLGVTSSHVGAQAANCSERARRQNRRQHESALPLAPIFQRGKPAFERGFARRARRRYIELNAQRDLAFCRLRRWRANAGIIDLSAA